MMLPVVHPFLAIGASLLLLVPSLGHAATNLRWNLRLDGSQLEFIEVVVDTKSLPGNAVIDSATFIAHIRHAPGAVDSLNVSFLDERLRALTSGHVYRRLFRHPYSQAGAVSSSGLQVQVRAAGGKADGVETPPRFSESQAQPSALGPADVEIGPPAGSAAAHGAARFNRDRRSFRRALREHGLAQAAQPVDPATIAAHFALPRLVYSRANAPIDPTIGRCMDYASRAVSAFSDAQRNGCQLAGHRWSPDYPHHFEWCMGASASDGRQETAARATALANCAGQGKK